MIDKKILNVLKVVAKNNGIRPVISTIRIVEGVAVGTDLENTVFVNIEAEKGLYCKNTGLKIEKILLNKDVKKIDIEDFPNIKIDAEIKDKIVCELDIKQLKELIKLHKNYIGSTENLALNGIRLVAKENKIKFITCNTYALVKNDIDADVKNEIEITIKESTIRILEKILIYEKSGKVVIKSDENQVLFITENFELLARTIDLFFPDYKGILRTVSKDIIVRIDRKELIEVLKKHLLITKNKQDGKFSSNYTFTSENLEISSFNEITGLKNNIGVVSNDNIKICLNDKSLLDLLKNVKSEFIQINMKDNRSTVYITSELSDIEFLMMPLAMREED